LKLYQKCGISVVNDDIDIEVRIEDSVNLTNIYNSVFEAEIIQGVMSSPLNVAAGEKW
jgi:hypothetical protein